MTSLNIRGKSLQCLFGKLDMLIVYICQAIITSSCHTSLNDEKFQAAESRFGFLVWKRALETYDGIIIYYLLTTIQIVHISAGKLALLQTQGSPESHLCSLQDCTLNSSQLLRTLLFFSLPRSTQFLSKHARVVFSLLFLPPPSGRLAQNRARSAACL